MWHAARAFGPFDAPLQTLAASHSVVLAETYPAAAYEVAGVSFGRSESKRRQEDRKTKANALLAHTERHRIGMSAMVRGMIVEGFGASKAGEDAFDAFAGLLLMIEVAEGRHDEAPTRGSADEWEGWILGV